MSTLKLIVIASLVVAINGALPAIAQKKAPLRYKKRVQPPFRYEAEDRPPKNAAGEKRRDYAVLEAALNDLASPTNPEHKYHLQNVGFGREIVMDDTINQGDMFFELGGGSTNIDHEDEQPIPPDVQADFNRRNAMPPSRLADFKPANPDIFVRDLEKEFKDGGSFVDSFIKKYPKAWGYVWASRPGYSKDGRSAAICFEGGPNGQHGLDWTYFLIRNGKRWEVKWRHLHPRE